VSEVAKCMSEARLVNENAPSHVEVKEGTVCGRNTCHIARATRHHITYFADSRVRAVSMGICCIVTNHV
jgi:hypothetical protein